MITAYLCKITYNYVKCIYEVQDSSVTIRLKVVRLEKRVLNISFLRFKSYIIFYTILKYKCEKDIY